MATRSRPAQGNNSTNPPKPTRPAYKAPFPSTRIVNTGSVSHPKSGSGGRPRYKAQPAPTRTVAR